MARAHSYRPFVEAFERRQLLTGSSFLQGFVYFQNSSTPEPGVTVNLFDGTGTTQLDTTTTNSDGYYRFDGLDR